ncbi:hypothetical protein Ahy_B07g086574 [Arachis hypogaea]|uniref:FAR1 domain-containing protein n=1 Tax=Arachis hypogaea TaxID=3818 RepID=A0A444YA33_ARAHY|nr:hypothetical protein Ahy_B07g086574 [Arachis hypogaea]
MLHLGWMFCPRIHQLKLRSSIQIPKTTYSKIIFLIDTIRKIVYVKKSSERREEGLDIEMEEDGYDEDSFNQAPGNFSMSPEAGLLSAEDVLKLEFSCLEEATIFYEEYSRAKGFTIRQEKKLKNKKGEFVRLEKQDRKREHKVITRCGCPGEMRIKLNSETGKWFVSCFVEDHNHELLPEKFVDYLPLH